MQPVPHRFWCVQLHFMEHSSFFLKFQSALFCQTWPHTTRFRTEVKLQSSLECDPGYPIQHFITKQTPLLWSAGPYFHDLEVRHVHSCYSCITKQCFRLCTVFRPQRYGLHLCPRPVRGGCSEKSCVLRTCLMRQKPRGNACFGPPPTREMPCLVRRRTCTC